MTDKLTRNDRGDLPKIAASMAAKFFRGPGCAEFIHDDKLEMTEPMLAHLIEEALRLGFDLGRQTS